MTRYEEEEVNIDKLLGVPIKEAIAYLVELKKKYSDKKDVTIFQKWKDYENNYFVVTYS